MGGSKSREGEWVPPGDQWPQHHFPIFKCSKKKKMEKEAMTSTFAIS